MSILFAYLDPESAPSDGDRLNPDGWADAYYRVEVDESGTLRLCLEEGRSDLSLEDPLSRNDFNRSRGENESRKLRCGWKLFFPTAGRRLRAGWESGIKRAGRKRQAAWTIRRREGRRVDCGWSFDFSDGERAPAGWTMRDRQERKIDAGWTMRLRRISTDRASGWTMRDRQDRKIDAGWSVV